MPFNTLFGGSLIAPAIPTYLSLSFSVNTILGWPLESNNLAPTVAEIIDCTATVGALTLQLSDARQISTGYTALFNNIGANTFTVLDAQGNTLFAPTSGQVWQLYLADNSTLQGTWRVFQYGAGVSNANAASLAGAGLKAITTTLNERIVINPQNATYNIVNGDRATCIEWTGGAGTFNLPNPATVGADWFVYVKNAGTGQLNVVPANGGTLDGLSTMPYQPGNSSAILCDGANFITVGFGQSIVSAFNFISIDASGNGNLVLGAAQQNKIAYKFTGTLTGARTIVIPGTVQQYWVDNETTGAFTLTVSTGVGLSVAIAQGFREILYCDGTNVLNATTVDPSQIPVLNAASNTFVGQVISTQVGTGANSGFYVNSSAPSYGWRNSSGAVDTRLWDAEATATDLIFRALNDAQSTTKTWMDVTRAGIAITALAFGNATDNPTYTFTGTGGISHGANATSSTVSNDGSASAFQVASATPSYGLRSTSGAADAKQWGIEASATQLFINLFNDANNVTHNAAIFTRAGVALTAIQFGNTTDNPTYSFVGTGASSFGSTANNAQYTLTVNAGPTGAAMLGVNDSGTEEYVFMANDSGGAIGGIPTAAGGVRNVSGHPFYVAVGGTAIFQVAALASGGTQIADDAGAFFQSGYRGLPPNNQNANYTTVLADRGKMIVNLAGTHTFTIAANASVAYNQGDSLTFLNANGAGNLTIAINTDTLVFTATGATGSRTLAANGIATAVKAVNATTWYISGTGLT